jgi:hypothetical protein
MVIVVTNTAITHGHRRIPGQIRKIMVIIRLLETAAVKKRVEVTKNSNQNSHDFFAISILTPLRR